MTKLVVDLSDPEMAEAVSECAEGEEKTFTNVTATMTKRTDKTVEFDVSNLEYADQPAESAESADEEASEAPTAVKAPVAKAMQKGY